MHLQSASRAAVSACGGRSTLHPAAQAGQAGTTLRAWRMQAPKARKKSQSAERCTSPRPSQSCRQSVQGGCARPAAQQGEAAACTHLHLWVQGIVWVLRKRGRPHEQAVLQEYNDRQQRRRAEFPEALHAARGRRA